MLITVGVVARNEASHIAGTLDALLALDFPKEQYEIIVVDGNSSDATREIASRTLAAGSVAHRVLNEHDFGGRGLCFARNLVIDQSSADARYIAFTDGDCLVDRAWLGELHKTLEALGPDVAGAGGGRDVAPTHDPKERVINTFVTSRIGSGWAPAFWDPPFSQKPVEWIASIPNYNALYRKEVLQRFRYDEALLLSDDNEINYRITQAGYRFRLVRSARIWHRETSSVREFGRNMFGYGTNIANSMRKHKTLMRAFVPLSVGLLAYLVTLPLAYALLGALSLLPLLAYAALGGAALLEVALATRSLHALWVIVLFPVEHVCYGAGVLSNLVFKHVLPRAN